MAFSCLILGFIAGCGSGFNGTLNPGGGSGPTPPTGAPTVTSLSPSTTVAGGGDFTLTVTGTNFAAGDTVDWEFTPLTSMYVSSTEMKAQVPASLIAKPGSATIVVVTPTPSSMNFGSTFTVTAPQLQGNASYTMTTVNVAANDMVWDPASQQLFLSVPGNGSITPLNPTTGQLGTPVMTGAPDRLAISDDSTYLYVGMDSSGSVQRFTLPGMTPDISIPLGSYLSYGPMYALDVEVAPGSPHTVAISRGTTALSPREEGGVAIYDDATPRPNSVPGVGYGPGPIDSLLWKADATAIYGANTETTSSDLYVLPVDASGVQAGKDYIVGGTFGFVPRDYNRTTGYVYAITGQAVDPANGSVVGTFPFNAVLGGASGYDGVVTDGKLNIAYFLVQAMWDTTYQEDVLEAFDLTHYTFLGGIAVPETGAQQVKMVRWGSNGLALLTKSSVILISGGFVTSPAPQ
ncbi:MAG TPA: IPT/TIG domain-containing protein [Terracidiphilus sp.]|nr:IPT/TIG domain-containing protein [Terracidiphilus sp.]